MSAMVEKVARAIADAFTNGTVQLEDMPEHQQRPLLVAARAAIEAMVEPTEEMIAAGEDEDIFMANGTLISRASAKTHYEVMIQAALKEEAQ